MGNLPINVFTHANPQLPVLRFGISEAIDLERPGFWLTSTSGLFAVHPPVTITVFQSVRVQIQDRAGPGNKVEIESALGPLDLSRFEYQREKKFCEGAMHFAAVVSDDVSRGLAFVVIGVGLKHYEDWSRPLKAARFERQQAAVLTGEWRPGRLQYSKQQLTTEQVERITVERSAAEQKWRGILKATVLLDRKSSDGAAGEEARA